MADKKATGVQNSPPDLHQQAGGSVGGKVNIGNGGSGSSADSFINKVNAGNPDTGICKC